LGSVANSIYTCVFWQDHAARLLQNQGLSTSAAAQNSPPKWLYFEFATDPFGGIRFGADDDPTDVMNSPADICVSWQSPQGLAFDADA
jgi:hypothetical protein